MGKKINLKELREMLEELKEICPCDSCQVGWSSWSKRGRGGCHRDCKRLSTWLKEKK